MSSTRSALLAIGAAMLVVAVMIPLTALSTHSFEAFLERAFLTLFVAPFLFIVGLVLTIVGATRRPSSGTQAPVSSVEAPGVRVDVRSTPEPAARCPGCGEGLPGATAYCIHCGRRVHDG